MKRLWLVVMGLLFLSGLCLGGEAEQYTLKYIYHDSPVRYRNQFTFRFKLEFPPRIQVDPMVANMKFDYNSVEELMEILEDRLSINLQIEEMKIRYSIMDKRETQTIDTSGKSGTVIKLSAVGKISDVIGPNATDPVDAEKQKISPEDYIKTVIAINNFYYWILPVNPVQVGDEWLISHKFPSFRKGVPDLEFPITNRLVRVKETGKHRLATIASRGDWDVQTHISGEDLNVNNGGKEPGQIKFEEFSLFLPLSWTGETVFDITDGCPKSRKVDLKGEGLIEVTESGQAIPLRISVKLKITSKRI